MCGIIGAFGQDDAFKIIQDGLEAIKERGRDGYGYYDGKKIVRSDTLKGLRRSDSKNILGHSLHSIVSTVPQPLRHDGTILSANCEIYNWKALAKKYSITCRNDADLLLKLIQKRGIRKALTELRGVYAFAYWIGDKIYLARDIIGIKPLWYAKDHGFLFCSEKKALPQGCAPDELNPRNILCYDLNTNKTRTIPRNFERPKESEDEEKAALGKLDKTFRESINLRIPKRKFGLFFSGGLDSVLVASYLKEAGQDFTCYVAGASKDSSDVIRAQDAAKALGLRLKEVIIDEKGTVKGLGRVIPLIEDSNVIKAGVALPLYFAARQARKDGCKVIFSGAGADELFGGYNRYKSSALAQLNKDCYSDILRFYERNSYRDDIITMNNNLELRVPFLDRKMAILGLGMKPALKIAMRGERHIEKHILRLLARERGIPTRLANAPKKAAQYGSGFDKRITKLAKKDGFPSKSAYLDTFLRKPNLRLGALISSGKDSWYSAYIMARQNYDISCMISLRSENPDSYMFHTPAIELVRQQSQASGIPVVWADTAGEKEQELKDLKQALKEAKETHGIQGICTGALYSNYQRERIERVCDSLGLKTFSPLWHMDQEQELRSLLREGFSIILTKIAAYGLDKSWLGRPLTKKDVDRLAALGKKHGLNVAGEGGEFESLVLDCPLFKRRLKIKKSEVIEENENTAHLLIRSATLLAKE